MLKTKQTNQFKKDVKLAKKRNKKIEKLKRVMSLIVSQEELPAKYENHKLSGIYKGCLECHIEPNWLLVYRISDNIVTFIATGSHSDLF